MISALYIVKDNSDVIRESLVSCQDFADEIVIVDTGSTDNTVEICMEYTNNIYYYKWCNDFSDARNFAITKCKGDIILFLDSDEYFVKKLTKENHDYIEGLFSDNPNLDVCKLKTFNVEKNGTTKYISYNTKIFRNNGTLKYKRPIHEVLYKDTPISYVILKDYDVIHTGYYDSIVPEKSMRNIEILKAIKDKTTMDYFYLAREYMNIEDYEKCNEYCNVFFLHKDYKDVVRNSEIGYLIYYYKIRCNEVLKLNLDDLKLLFDLNDILPDMPETYYRIGQIYMTKDLNLALEYFNKAIKADYEYNKPQTNMFTYYESVTYHRLAILYEMLGNKKQAINKAMVCCMLDAVNNNTNYGDIISYVSLLDKDNQPKIVKNLYKIFKPRFTSEFALLTKVLSDTNLTDAFTTVAHTYNTKHNGANMEVYYAIILSGGFDSIVDMLFEKYRTIEDETLRLKYMFIIMVGIIYSNSNDIYKKYIHKIPEGYKEVLDYQYKFIDIDNEMAINNLVLAYIKLYQLRREYLIDLLVKCFTKNNVIYLFNNFILNKDYVEIIRFTDKMFLKLKNNNVELDEETYKLVIEHRLFAYFMLKLYKNFMTEYNNNLGIFKDEVYNIGYISPFLKYAKEKLSDKNG